MEEHIILIVGLYFSCQGEVGLCRHPVQLSSKSLAGSRVGRAGGGKQARSSAGALFHWHLQKVLNWMWPGMTWQGLTILLWLSQRFFLLDAACKPRGSTGSFCVPLHQAAELQGGLCAPGKGCTFFFFFFLTLLQGALYVALGKPKALAFKSSEGACVPSHRCVCKECACPRPAL